VLELPKDPALGQYAGLRLEQAQLDDSYSDYWGRRYLVAVLTMYEQGVQVTLKQIDKSGSRKPTFETTVKMLLEDAPGMLFEGINRDATDVSPVVAEGRAATEERTGEGQKDRETGRLFSRAVPADQQADLPRTSPNPPRTLPKNAVSAADAEAAHVARQPGTAPLNRNLGDGPVDRLASSVLAGPARRGHRERPVNQRNNQ